MGLKLLVISDSHDSLPAINELLGKKHYVMSDYILHLGDIISPFALMSFLNTQKRFIGVFGNNDGDRVRLKELCSSLKDQPLRVSFEGTEFILLHGFGPPEITKGFVYSLARGLNSDGGRRVILYGHTHQAEIRRLGNILIVNPGALSGYLTDRKTYALIEVFREGVRASLYDLISGRILRSHEIYWGKEHRL